MPVTGNMIRDYPAIRQDLLNTGVVENSALASIESIYTSNNTTGFRWEGKDPDESKSVLISFRSVSPEYMKTLGMHIVEGRDFTGSAALDSAHVIITETMAHIMGKGSALGKVIYSMMIRPPIMS